MSKRGWGWSSFKSQETPALACAILTNAFQLYVLYKNLKIVEISQNSQKKNWHVWEEKEWQIFPKNEG